MYVHTCTLYVISKIRKHMFNVLHPRYIWLFTVSARQRPGSASRGSPRRRGWTTTRRSPQQAVFGSSVTSWPRPHLTRPSRQPSGTVPMHFFMQRWIVTFMWLSLLVSMMGLGVSANFSSVCMVPNRHLASSSSSCARLFWILALCRRRRMSAYSYFVAMGSGASS